MSEELVQVDALRLHAAGRSIVDDVSLTVAEGESVALVGASGSGKTTTALAVLGHLAEGIGHLGGSVRVAGKPMLPTPPPGVRGQALAYLGQDPGTALNPYRRVAGTLRDALGGGKDVAELLDRVGLARTLARRYPHELSGGQQQRVALAVALARKPRLLVLDEPTSALDVLAAEEVRGELMALRAQGVSLLWISHDLAVVRHAVDRMLVFDEGRLVEDGTAERLISAPKSPAAKALVSAAAPTPVRVAGSGPPVLRAENLTAGYPGTPSVLNGVSLQVSAGGCLAVLGVSGVGKSTLARCLVGLHRPLSGTIRLDAAVLPADVRARDREQRAGVQLVAQDPSSTLHPRHDVRTTLSRPLRLFRGIRNRAALDAAIGELLGSVHLPRDYAGRLPSELSGGQRQRVALARALAADPRVLICDEVTAALDTVTQLAMLNLLGELRAERGLALVIVTHHAGVARHLAEQVLVLADGRVACTGGVDEVLPTGRELASLTELLGGSPAH